MRSFFHYNGCRRKNQLFWKRKVNFLGFSNDNLNADLNAKKAGMKVCGVYDPSSEEYVDQMKAATDYYIHNFSELPNIVF